MEITLNTDKLSFRIMLLLYAGNNVDAQDIGKMLDLSDEEVKKFASSIPPEKVGYTSAEQAVFIALGWRRALELIKNEVHFPLVTPHTTIKFGLRPGEYDVWEGILNNAHKYKGEQYNDEIPMYHSVMLGLLETAMPGLLKHEIPEVYIRKLYDFLKGGIPASMKKYLKERGFNFRSLLSILQLKNCPEEYVATNIWGALGSQSATDTIKIVGTGPIINKYDCEILEESEQGERLIKVLNPGEYSEIQDAYPLEEDCLVYEIKAGGETELIIVEEWCKTLDQCRQYIY